MNRNPFHEEEASIPLILPHSDTSQTFTPPVSISEHTHRIYFTPRSLRICSASFTPFPTSQAVEKPEMKNQGGSSKNPHRHLNNSKRRWSWKLARFSSFRSDAPICWKGKGGEGKSRNKGCLVSRGWARRRETMWNRNRTLVSAWRSREAAFREPRGGEMLSVHLRAPTPARIRTVGGSCMCNGAGWDLLHICMHRAYMYAYMHTW